MVVLLLYLFIEGKNEVLEDLNTLVDFMESVSCRSGTLTPRSMLFPPGLVVNLTIAVGGQRFQ